MPFPSTHRLDTSLDTRLDVASTTGIPLAEFDLRFPFTLLEVWICAYLKTSPPLGRSIGGLDPLIWTILWSMAEVVDLGFPPKDRGVSLSHLTPEMLIEHSDLTKSGVEYRYPTTGDSIITSEDF